MLEQKEFTNQQPMLEQVLGTASLICDTFPFDNKANTVPTNG